MIYDRTTGMFPSRFLRKFSEGLCAVNKGVKAGFINILGDEVIPYEFNVAGIFSDSLAPVAKSNKFGYINKEGNCVIPFKYLLASSFVNGSAQVKLDHKEGYIDKKGVEYWED